jgi:hypothetical protein
LTQPALKSNGIKLGNAKMGAYSNFRYVQFNNFAISALFRGVSANRLYGFERFMALGRMALN